ncbi:MAG: hypothetical protein ACR2M3_10460 [Thermomicrobiales bacterium]
MPPISATPMPLTPWETIEGWQDITSGACVIGWAWDGRRPNTPVCVEIYDGDALLATVVADIYRKDLRDAGKGDGRHGFLYPLAAHIRDRKMHHVTVRVAGTQAMLRDVMTGSVPKPIRRRDRPATSSIPHFSLPPAARWCYYTLLKTLLRPFPHPIWRLPASLLATSRMLADGDGRRLDAALLHALGLPAGPYARWRMRWMRSYQRQADLILSLQTAHFTRAWVRRHIQCPRSLPPGGAILVAPHHAMQFAGTLALTTMVEYLGAISAEAADPDQFLHTDPTLVNHWRQMRLARQNVGHLHVLRQHEAGRRGLQLLQRGGYLVILADELRDDVPLHPLLGRAVAIPRGATWFAQHAGKPIIPWMVVPRGLGWWLWVGEAVPATQEGVLRGLEACLRLAPSSWARTSAMTWLAAPVWRGEGRCQSRYQRALSI